MIHDYGICRDFNGFKGHGEGLFVLNFYLFATIAGEFQFSRAVAAIRADVLAKLNAEGNGMTIAASGGWLGREHF